MKQPEFLGDGIMQSDLSCLALLIREDHVFRREHDAYSVLAINGYSGRCFFYFSTDPDIASMDPGVTVEVEPAYPINLSGDEWICGLRGKRQCREIGSHDQGGEGFKKAASVHDIEHSI